LGCTVIELLNEKPPYFDLNPWTALIKIVNETEEPIPIPEGISDDANDFLQKCFIRDPNLRPSA
jgi:serine/threonine protein kinase